MPDTAAQITSNSGTSRTRDWHDARWGDGRERPDDLAASGGPQLIERSFVFVDLCSFTLFCDTHGPLRATFELDRFRQIVRGVAVRRGIRVAKWLGDGALLVALDPGAAAAAAVEAVGRTGASGALSARGGVCNGAALLFEGDDHVGRPVNLASRLCDEAGPGEVLATAEVIPQLPSWVLAGEGRSLDVRGVGPVEGVRPLRADDTVTFAP